MSSSSSSFELPRDTPLAVLGGSPLPRYAFAPDELAGSAGTVEAVYVHVPFCSTKCHYCDFYSLAGHLEEGEAYLDSLERDLVLQTRFFGVPRPSTVFIGGGTPTLLPAKLLERLLGLLRKHLDLTGVAEFTIEANPNTFDGEKAAIAKAGGVNRISFGAQSFVPAELETLQRDHDPASVPTAFATARAAGITNLSCDLIFGIPGQTLETWEFSLASALALEPSHMSCYSLTYEPNTAMTARLRRGEFATIDEELELAMFEHVYARLRGAGFRRYETSNYARVAADGVAEVCRHNLHYWKGRNWLAFGPSSGAHVARPELAGDGPVTWQWKNVGSLTHYLEALGGESPVMPWTGMEALKRRPWAGAVAVFWLRLAEGLDYAEFEARTGVDPRRALHRALDRYVELGLVEFTERVARITDAGVAVSNRLLSEVLSVFESTS